MKEDDVESAIKEFKIIIESCHSEDENEWSFKSAKQLIKICVHLERYEEAIKYMQLLLKLASNVEQSYAEDSIGKILSNYSVCNDAEFVNRLGDIILSYLNSLNSSKNGDRLWLRININRLYSLLEKKDYNICPHLMSDIEMKLKEVSDTTKNSFSLEVIAAEIQYHLRPGQMDLRELSSLHRKSFTVSSAVSHPRFMGIIRECGAILYFYRGNYEKARLEFYECFKNYDEAGSSCKKKILKYLALCSLLTESEVNPFESQETQTYSQFPEYANLLLLIKSYDQFDIDSFNSIISRMHRENDPLLNDEIFEKASKEILKNLKARTLIHILGSFKTVKFSFIKNKLGVNQEDLEKIIFKLVNQGDLWNLKLDFVNDYVETTNSETKLINSRIKAKDVYVNFKTLDAFSGFQGPSEEQITDDKMDIDAERQNSSSLYEQGSEYGITSDTLLDLAPLISKVLYFTERPSLVSDWFGTIESWLQCLSSAIPSRVKHELSQKDQIFSEQRAENLYNSANAIGSSNLDNSRSNFQNGIPNASSDDNQENFQDNEDEPNLEKVELLKNWCDELESSFCHASTKFRHEGVNLGKNL